MNISYNWLKEFLDIDFSPEQISNKLTSIGLETGGIKEIQSIKGGLKGLVLGLILEVSDHPNSEHLKITKVDVGNSCEPLQIVCGAPNVKVGLIAVVATIGSELHLSDGSILCIKKSKIRGVESFGMLCSEAEIGVGKDNSGIILIEKDPVLIGISASKFYGIESDYCLEVDITPNRNDATSHFGVARDLAAQISSDSGRILKVKKVEVNTIDKGDCPIDVIVDNSYLCPRFMGVVIRGVTVDDSPNWIKDRLSTIGVNSINNIVDVTNYVLHEIGQPLHCYDLDKVGSSISVSLGNQDEKVITLDGQERIVSDNDILVLAQSGKTACIAGVMGVSEYGVNKDTKNIFIEAANFHPTYVRKTARRLGINSDSSFRFERGLDPNACEYALFRAINLILSISSGVLDGGVFDYYPQKKNPFEVSLSIHKMNSLIGYEIPIDKVLSILESLDIEVVKVDGGKLHLLVPAYRVDVTRDVDVIEEIMRIYGYNNIDLTGYIKANLSGKTISDKAYNRSLVISEQLVGEGYNEILCNSLSSNEFYKGISSYPETRLVKIQNPLSSDLGVMRQTLLFGGLQSISRNARRQQRTFYFFELGNVYNLRSDDNDIKLEKPLSNFEEKMVLGLFTAGYKHSNSWLEGNKLVSPFEIKASVLNILDRLGICKDTRGERLVEFDIFSGKSLEIFSKQGVLARIGKVKSNFCNMFDIDFDVYYAEVYWSTLCKISDKVKVESKDISKFPVVKRDLSLLLDLNVTFADIVSIAKQTERKLLSDIELFDVYEGDKLPVGKKSYAVSFYLQDENKTMSDKQIDSIMQKIQFNLHKHLSAELRG